MKKILNFLFLILIVIFFLKTYQYYSSKNNIEARNYNRTNINEIIDKKIINIPVLENDTKNVIEFNDGFSTEIKNEKSRKFWNLLKFK